VIVEDVWRRQHQWSAVAGAKSDALKRWRWINLSLVLGGALLGVLATQSWFTLVPNRILGTAGAVLLAVAALIQTRCLGAEKVKDRVTARAAAESVKAAVFQYLAGVVPYADEGRDTALSAELDRIEAEGERFASLVRDASPDGDPLPAFRGVAGYVRARAVEQLAFHEKGRKRHTALEGRWRAAEVGATLLAAVLSAVGGAMEGTDLSGWVGVATTLAGAVAAHLASEQHARISAAYAVTADRLEKLVRGFEAASTDDEDVSAAFVVGVEGVLARQNQTWVSTLVPSP
jgi:SMODS and SLOG-associating 2TM effector domain 1/Protein of unknown function (DUF4231)